jgi:uncharacterized protein (DUF362 family)
MLSIIQKPELCYPPAGDGFCPDQPFPEYRHGLISPRPNPVYQAVRDTLAQAGLDRDHFGTPDWNPLGSWIRPGQRVFVLCNFVYHCRGHESIHDFYGKCTHASVIRAMIDYVLIAAGPEGRVVFGNAPLQGAIWDLVSAESHAREVADFYEGIGAPVELRDLRLHIAERNAMGWITRVERRGEEGGISVDLGSDSLLTALDPGHPHYRVSDYDPDRTEACHANGKHVYIVNRAIIDSDVIISIPKLKTHSKVGITCALKGCVGAIGHKDCLAHHRLGPPERNGDEYPADPVGLLYRASRLHDSVQRTLPETRVGRALRLGDRVVRKALSKAFAGTSGTWWGNDTCWRMSLDIGRIIAHADKQGILQDAMIRPHLALIDGVIGGEGEGPLNPRGVDTHALLFADDPVEADWGAARLMGYEPENIALVREAARLERYPVTRRQPSEFKAIVNGEPVPLDAIHPPGGHRYQPPPGWVGKL